MLFRRKRCTQLGVCRVDKDQNCHITRLRTANLERYIFMSLSAPPQTHPRAAADKRRKLVT
jgi:hypothetical protein